MTSKKPRLTDEKKAARKRAYAKAYYEANADKISKHKKAYYEANADKINKYSKAYKQAKRKETAAAKLLRYYVKTRRIIKTPCYKCGELKVEAHHYDHDAPLSVTWLCRLHHKQLHGDHKRWLNRQLSTKQHIEPPIDTTGQQLELQLAA